VWLSARALARIGVPQVVVTGSGTELGRRLRTAGVRVSSTAWRMGLDPRVLWPILRETRQRPVILHAHDAHALTLAGVVSHLARTPLVVTRRVDIPLRRRGFWGSATRIIAISDAVADVLQRDGISRDRITVVNSGISLESVATVTKVGIRGRLGLGPDALVAASVGALVGHKDHHTLIGAAERLSQRVPDLHWVVAGEGELRPSLERQLAVSGLRSRVHLVGHMDDPVRLIADADLFVMSSKAEGLGTSVLDAMALGIPVASTSAGGLPEMLANGAGLLVPPGDPVALGEAVERIVTETELRAALVTRAKAEVTKFTDVRMAEALASVYRSCVHSHDGS
jgi:glycosyltransferase involved in cell wall biosynthesis